MARFKSKLANNEILVLIADTEKGQLELLAEGLSHIHVGQNPYEISRKALLFYLALLLSKPIKKSYLLPQLVTYQQNISNNSGGL